MRLPNHEKRGERGAALVWIAGAMVLLLTMAAFATDLGWILLWNSRLQAAADAAALAGVTNLPAFDPQPDAMAAAAANGFPDAGFSDEELADNSYRVTLDTDIDTFFLGLIGFDSFHIRQTAAAQYVKPVRLGSPDNEFGNPADQFWAAINGQFTEIQQGDPYASRCTSENNEASSPGCNGPQNPEYRPGGYYYGIEIAENSDNLGLRIYDGGHYVSGGGQFAGGTSNTGDRSWAWDWPDDQRGVELEYILWGPDSTPTDPTDQAVNGATQYCSETFPVNGPNNEGHFNSYNGIHNCSVPGDLTPGIWVLQLPAPLWEGATKFSIEATVVGSTQPKVYGILDMSVYVNFFAGSAQPFLAEIRPEHTDKTLFVDIWDLGDNDGPASIQILPPSGTRACSWTSSNNDPGSHADCVIDISNQRYNAEWIFVEIPLDGYSCNIAAPTGCWWTVHIQTSSGAAHDRTTWAARVSGDPVRLVD